MSSIINSLSNSDYTQIISAFFGAFFAFVFFVIGQLWISTSKERKQIIADLEKMKEYTALQTYFFEQNILNFKNLEQIKPISILLNKFKLFPIEECIYQKFGKFKVTEPALKFVVHLRAINEDINTLNNWVDHLSEFSKIAMLEKREDEFSETMTNNSAEFQKKASVVKQHLESTQKKMDPLIAELDFTIKYVKSGFWYKGYFIIRARLDKNFRERKIQKLAITKVQ